MDIETFKTLAEVLAFECKDDPAKLAAFCDVFYGEYRNKGSSFVNLNAPLSDVTVCTGGKMTPGYITSWTWDEDTNFHDSLGGVRSYFSGGGFTVKLEIRGRF